MRVLAFIQMAFTLLGPRVLLSEASGMAVAGRATPYLLPVTVLPWMTGALAPSVNLMPHSVLSVMVFDWISGVEPLSE